MYKNKEVKLTKWADAENFAENEISTPFVLLLFLPFILKDCSEFLSFLLDTCSEEQKAFLASSAQHTSPGCP